MSDSPGTRGDTGCTCVCSGKEGMNMHVVGASPGLPAPPPRCKQCSGTLHSGAYRATGEPGVFVCSSHRPETASASPTSPSLASRWPGATSMDLETPGGLRKTREASGQRDTGPKARLPGWDPAAGSASARGSTPAATNPPAPTSSRVPAGSPAAPRLMAGPAGGKASTHVTSSSLTIWPSPAGSPPPTGTSCAPDPCPATPQGWATPRVTAPQTKLSSRPASPVPASTPAWTPSSSKTQQARERFFQTPGATPGPGPAAADTPSGDSRREQALSFLRKALPELGAPGRWVQEGPGARWGRGSQGGARGSGPAWHVVLGLPVPGLFPDRAVWGLSWPRRAWWP